MRVIIGALLVAAVALVFGASLTANAAIHEIVAAYCSGGDDATGQAPFVNWELEPPGVTGGSNADNFAKPPLASGAVEVTDPPPPPIVIEITDKPNAKFEAGVYEVTAGELGLEDVDHPSAEHCAKFPG